MNTQNTVQNNAVALRTRLRQERAALPADQRSRGGLLMRARLSTWLNVTRDEALRAGQDAPSRVAAFWPMEDEPDLRPLLEQWFENGISISLPVIVAASAALEFRLWRPDTTMQAGRYGILEPQSGVAPPPDIILVPTLGYTAAADRLGYGGGYYDRTLAALKADGHTCTTIGIAWSGGLLNEDYRPAEHDVRLDAILTPDGWVPQAPLSTTPASDQKPGSLGTFTLN